jgi:hypothetical protein
MIKKAPSFSSRHRIKIKENSKCCGTIQVERIL